MQKLSGTSLGKNKKSCRIFHNKSNKIEFAFFWFFYDFLRILQESAKWLYYLRFTSAAGSLESFRFLQICLYFADKTPECFLTLQCHPWGWWPARVEEFRRGPVTGSAGDGRGVVLGALGPISTLGWCGDSAGRVARRRWPRRAAALPAPARLRPGQRIGRLGQLW
jgi:hypothetical protein